MVFTVVNPMDNQDGFGEALCDLPQARIAPDKKILENTFQDTVFWCNLKLAQQGGLQTLSNAVILYNTLPAEFIEKAICMKTKDQLYQNEKRDSETACCS